MHFIIIIIIIIIFIIIICISSWYKLIKNTNKNQPSSRYNYSFYATLCTKKMQDLVYLLHLLNNPLKLYN